METINRKVLAQKLGEMERDELLPIDLVPSEKQISSRYPFNLERDRNLEIHLFVRETKSYLSGKQEIKYLFLRTDQGDIHQILLLTQVYLSSPMAARYALNNLYKYVLPEIKDEKGRLVKLILKQMDIFREFHALFDGQKDIAISFEGETYVKVPEQGVLD